MVPGDRIGSLLLQRVTPVLGAPLTGVGRIYRDHADTPAGCHRDQSMTESGGGDTGHGASQLLALLAAAQHFPTCGAGVGEVEVFYDHCSAALLLGVVKQGGNRCTDPTITTRRSQPGRDNLNSDGTADRIAGGIEDAQGEMVGVEIDA
jgi:hypothetical protein